MIGQLCVHTCTHIQMVYFWNMEAMCLVQVKSIVSIGNKIFVSILRELCIIYERVLGSNPNVNSLSVDILVIKQYENT